VAAAAVSVLDATPKLISVQHLLLHIAVFIYQRMDASHGPGGTGVDAAAVYSLPMHAAEDAAHVVHVWTRQFTLLLLLLQVGGCCPRGDACHYSHNVSPAQCSTCPVCV
jgi:hypothetical protein